MVVTGAARLKGVEASEGNWACPLFAFVRGSEAAGTLGLCLSVCLWYFLRIVFGKQISD